MRIAHGGNVLERPELIALAQSENHLTRAELVAISRNAFEAAWIAEHQRARYLDRLDNFARQWTLR